MKKLQGKASEILYDMLEGRYTIEHDVNEVYFIESATDTKFLVDEDVKFYLKLMEEQGDF